jgi:hypothetical protein
VLFPEILHEQGLMIVHVELRIDERALAMCKRDAVLDVPGLSSAKAGRAPGLSFNQNNKQYYE